ncbi:MAG: hypothetical protein IE926_13820 [Micrococcales bacterium]|nr:hypothetical protein [Micrococcales bacterium]
MDVVEAARTRAGGRAKTARGAWVALTLSGAATFWATNLLISLTPAAAAYRSAQSIDYVPMLVEAAAGGLVLAGLFSLIMLRWGARLPGSGWLRHALFLAICALVLVTAFVEVPAKLGAGGDDPGRWLLVATVINTIRIVALGLTIGLVGRVRDDAADSDSPRATGEDTP